MKYPVIMFCLFLNLPVFTQSWHTIRAISLWNGYELSDSWLKGFREQVCGADSGINGKDVGVDNLLSRAKKAGYAHVIAVFEPRVWGSCTTAAGNVEQRMLFYPEARDPETGNGYSYFAQAYKKADDSGFVLIPLFPVACRTGKEWQDLHPDLRSHRAPDIKLNLLANGNDTAFSTPLADDGTNGFDAHLEELVKRIAKEYASVKKSLKYHRSPAPPFLFMSYDENWGISSNQQLKDKKGKRYYVPGKKDRRGDKVPFINLTLLVGQGNPYDTAYCSRLMASQKISLQAAVRRLYAYSIWKRANMVHAVCGDGTRLMIMGQMFDPQFGGEFSWETWAGNPDKKETPKHITLTGGSTADLLALPGLSDRQKNLVKKSVVLAQWHYATEKENPSPPFPDPYPPDFISGYDPFKTFAYFSGKGFDFISYSTLCVAQGKAEPDSGSRTSMRATVAALASPEFSDTSGKKGRALGFVAGYWPCFYEPGARCPYFSCGRPCACRCGNLKSNSYWYDSRDRYDQPLEFNTIETLKSCADSLVILPPH